MKKCFGALLVVACKTPAVATVSLSPPPTAASSTVAIEPAPSTPCANASHHEVDSAMKAAGLELCWRDAVVHEGMAGDSEAGFVALVHGDEVLSQAALGGSDAKGYGWTGDAKLLGARASTIDGHAIITVRWSQRTSGWSTGMGGSTNILDVMTAVCAMGDAVKCPFVRGTERELTVIGDAGRRDREAWKVDIGGDGVVTATHTKHFQDEETRAPERVPLF